MAKSAVLISNITLEVTLTLFLSSKNLINPSPTFNNIDVINKGHVIDIKVMDQG